MENSFIAFRLPEENYIQYFTTNQAFKFESEFILDKNKKGFVFSSFLKDADKNKFFEYKDTLNQVSYEEFLQLNITFDKFSSTVQSEGLDKVTYTNAVEKAINHINNQEVEKVVISRFKKHHKPNNYDIKKHFSDLCKLYPFAFVSLVYVPDAFCWIGASPELLIKNTESGLFETIALAGTQKHQEGENIKEAIWRQKEIEEQALVSRYIISCFKKLRIREYQEIGPKTVKSGSLMHLKTVFKSHLSENNRPEMGALMLDLLHPTSAVCGMPKEKSLEIISQLEQYNRDFYSGFLGPVNLNFSTKKESESTLFVNLRCMQITDKELITYAGAGITEDSNPEKEWQETELKMQTILAPISNEL